MKEESKAVPAPASKPRPAQAPNTGPVDERREEAIRRMAYTLFEARGCIGGHELEDWLQAEVLVASASVASADETPAAVPTEAPAAAKKARPAAKKATVAAKATGPTAASAGAASKRASAKKPRAT